jgi:hypothetical protein
MKRLFIFCLMLTVTNVYAEMYKWVAPDGTVQYTQIRPPENAGYKVLRSSSSSNHSPATAQAMAASAPGAPKSLAERDAELKKSQAAKKEAVEKDALEQSRKEIEKANCDAAQHHLRTLNSGMRLADIDAKGNQYYLDERQRKEQIDAAQQNVSKYCK